MCNVCRQGVLRCEDSRHLVKEVMSFDVRSLLPGEIILRPSMLTSERHHFLVGRRAAARPCSSTCAQFENARHVAHP